MPYSFFSYIEHDKSRSAYHTPFSYVEYGVVPFLHLGQGRNYSFQLVQYNAILFSAMGNVVSLCYTYSVQNTLSYSQAED